MCGRYTLHRPKAKIIEVIQPDRWDDAERYSPRYNIAPTTPCLAVTSAESKRRLSLMQWGLIPHWAKSEDIGQRLINARSETADEKPSFRHLLGRRHCAVPMDGYFEWQHRGSRKQPFLIRAKDRHLLFALGLWDTWKNDEGTLIPSFTILTADAAPVIAPIHDRMPVVITADRLPEWLQTADAKIPASSTDALIAVAVSTRVNKVQNDSPDILEPAATQPYLDL